MSQAESESNADGVADLPAAMSRRERHLTLLEHGMHPTIDMDTGFWEVVRGVDHGVSIKDGDRLIGFLTRNECPVCHETGRLRLRTKMKDGDLTNPSYTFIRGVKTREPDGSDNDNNWIQNETVNRLEERYVIPITCGHDYFVGVARESAAREYLDWENSQKARDEFKQQARQLIEERDPPRLFGKGYSKGLILAAIYEELDARSYDARDLIDRDRLTKGQLFTVLVRLKSMTVSNHPDYTESDWLIVRDFGVQNGDVEWHIPEWVDFEGLTYSDNYRTELFGTD